MEQDMNFNPIRDSKAQQYGSSDKGWVTWQRLKNDICLH